MTKTVLAGMRPTGRLHLGNYLGSAKGMVELQNKSDYETYYMVVDLHGMTTPFDPKTIKQSARNVILDYLAIGLDPEKSAIFVQSDLADLHTQLAFYLSTVVTVARMNHLPTYKEKIKQHPDNVTMALLNYPVLMAADILMYKASLVPVGLDQESHIEVAREIARKMNQIYGTDFPEPKRFTIEGNEYIPSLTGEGKMSKSVEGSYISLTDDFESINKKIAKIPTDSGGGPGSKATVFATDPVGERDLEEFNKSHDAVQKSVNTLFTLIQLFEGLEKRIYYQKQYVSEGVRYSEIKRELAEAIYQELEPIQKRRKDLEKDPEYLEQVLKDGATRARRVAEMTITEVKTKMGLV